MQTGLEKLSLRVSGAFDSEQEIRAVNFVAGGRIVRLGDIAEVSACLFDPPQPMFRVNGTPAIGLGNRDARGTGDILEFGRNLRQAMAEIKADLPVGIEPILVADQAEVVDQAIGEFTKSLWQAIHHHRGELRRLGVRPGLVVALTIPLVLAIVFLVMDMPVSTCSAYRWARSSSR